MKWSTSSYLPADTCCALRTYCDISVYSVMGLSHHRTTTFITNPIFRLRSRGCLLDMRTDWVVVTNLTCKRKCKFLLLLEDKQIHCFYGVEVCAIVLIYLTASKLLQWLLPTKSNNMIKMSSNVKKFLRTLDT